MDQTLSTARLRPDLQRVADMVSPGARVLDIGCGDGSLLDYLHHQKQVDGRGIELSMQGVRDAVAQGLSVIQGDADTDLVDYPPGAFDFVILSQTLQATREPRAVLQNMLRIGRRAIVSFPNFGHWRVRWSLALGGRMPETRTLTYSWYDTPNIHLCTIRDFTDLCRRLDIVIERALTLGTDGSVRGDALGAWANLMGEQAIFLLRHRDGRPDQSA
jgi:methionine biosynthesis protein MetW